VYDVFMIGQLTHNGKKTNDNFLNSLGSIKCHGK
jgi:hypothetical protein